MDNITSVAKKDATGSRRRRCPAGGVITIMWFYYVSLYVSSSDELCPWAPVIRRRQSVSVMDAVVRSRASESLVFVTTERAPVQQQRRRLREPAPSLNTQGGAQYVHVLAQAG
jgi:hypothetical protein